MIIAINKVDFRLYNLILLKKIGTNFSRCKRNKKLKKKLIRKNNLFKEKIAVMKL